MAKAASKAATSKPKNTEQEEQPEAKSSKKMTKAEAEAIVKQYDGINGADIPELNEAKQVLKG